MHIKNLFSIILALALAGSGSTYAKTTPPDDVLEPTPTQSEILKGAISKLQHHHYQALTLNDDAGKKILARFIDLLDPARMHLLAEDIAKLEKFGPKLDDELKKGNLNHVFQVYNRFHEQRSNRLDYMLNDLAETIKKMDLEADEYLQIDRADAPWPANQAEAEDLWRRFLKNDVLNLKLNDKSTEEIVTTLEKRYHSQAKQQELTKSNDVFEIFMSAYTHSYDPHTDYMAPRESENFDIHMRGSLEGIGALLQREDEYIKVVELITGGPAERGNQLQAADRIIGVGQGANGEIVDVLDWRLDDVVDLIRGPKGSIVRLSVIPSNAADTSKTKIINITRDQFNLEDELAKKKVIHLERDETPYKIGVIELPAFYMDHTAAALGMKDYRSSTRDVERLIEELKKENIDGLIVDLRNNGGGSLEEARNLTGLFIETGPVVQIRYAGNIELLADNHPKVTYAGPLAVLVNRLSASASEILAGAIQDHGRGIVIGGQTYGKGTVQNLEALDPGRIKFTQAKFYRISGESTQARGIIPDIEFPALINNDEIGENSLPDALQWDRIKPVPFSSITDLSGIIPMLQEKHAQRAANDPDFRYLYKRIEFIQEKRNEKLLSLKESERRKESDAVEKFLLNLENDRRKAKGLPLYKTFAELETENEKRPKERKDEELIGNDLLQESGYILLDMMALAEQKPQPKVAAH